MTPEEQQHPVVLPHPERPHLSTYASPQAYREAAVLTASPVQLVVMLYDGIERFLRQAEVVMGQGDIPKANERMQKGEAIMEARIERAATKVEQVRNLLRPLRDAWAELAERGTSPEAALNAATQAIAR